MHPVPLLSSLSLLLGCVKRDRTGYPPCFRWDLLPPSLPRSFPPSASLNVCALCIYLARKGSQNNGPPRGRRRPLSTAIAVAVRCMAALTHRRPPPFYREGRSNNHIKRRERPTDRTGERKSAEGDGGRTEEERGEQSRAALQHEGHSGAR